LGRGDCAKGKEKQRCRKHCSIEHVSILPAVEILVKWS
jgi:hypothetical protein